LRQLLSKEKWDATTFLEKFYDGRIELKENVSAELHKSQTLSQIVFSEEIDDKENVTSQPRRSTRKRKLGEATKEEPIAKKTSRTSLTSNNSAQEQVQTISCEICLESLNASVSHCSFKSCV
jgi:hypothetical protein